MTYLIIHSLMVLILPPGLNIVLALIGILVFFFHRVVAFTLMSIAILSLWLFSTPIFSYNLIEILQNRYPVFSLTSNTPIAKHGAIVVLGGGDTVYVEHEYQPAVSTITLNRVRYAAYLHKKTHLPIIVSGGHPLGAPYSEADLMLNSLRDDFSVSSAIKEDKSLNTADESAFIKPILKEYNIDTIYLVTNAWHMPRSVKLFQRQNIQVIPAPMGYETYDHHYTLLSFIPNAQALLATTTAMHELIGMFIIG